MAVRYWLFFLIIICSFQLNMSLALSSDKNEDQLQHGQFKQFPPIQQVQSYIINQQLNHILQLINMISIKSSLFKMQTMLSQNAEKAFISFINTLSTDLNQAEQQISDHSPPINLKITDSKSIIDQKVLEIDIIESAELIKSEENIAPLTHQSNQVQLSPNKSNMSPKTKENRNHSNFKHIEEQKRAIYQELKQLDAEIAEIKGEGVTDGLLKRKEKQQESEEAKKRAKQLVRQLKAQKKQIQEKKRKEAEKALLLLKQQEEQNKKKRQQELIRVKEERRKAIEQRMEEERKKREQRRIIEKESNKLIKQLKKQQEMLKMKEQLPVQTGEIELKKKFVEKKQDINFREIEQHERRYIQRKQQERSVKKQRSQSVNHHQIHKYPKNVWIQNIQEEQIKRKEQQKLRQAHKRDQYEKRKKYGELVKNIFIPKQKKQTIEQPSNQKPHTPDGVILPKIAESDKRVTDSKPMKKFIEQNRPFATAHNPKPPRQPIIQPKEPVNNQLQKQRLLKQAQMRRQTKQRLKKLQNKSLQALPQYKSKYENYLGQVRAKLGNEASSWKKVIENDSLSKEEKYNEMVRRAAVLQTKAKVKEQLRKEGDQDALNLYIGSIQAKLAILQKF